MAIEADDLKLKRLIWSGEQYALSIERHWNVFFGLTAIFTIDRPRMRKLLPEGAAIHIQSVHRACAAELDNFDTFDNWWAFSRKLCDQYCEYYVLELPAKHNPFNLYFNQYPNIERSVKSFAARAPGYLKKPPE